MDSGADVTIDGGTGDDSVGLGGNGDVRSSGSLLVLGGDGNDTLRMDDVRSSVLSNISWLENNGFSRFARELESELRAAEAAASAPPEVAKRATPNQPTMVYGTCFAVSDAEVLTSQHVVASASQITVEFRDGVEKGAVVLEQSQSTDLALLKISGETPSFLPLASMRSLEVGQEVFTVGFPVTSILGSDAKFTEGSVSAVSGIKGDASYFQMSVPIQPGNSGGPVVNMQGEVVGVVASTAAIEAFYTMSGSLPQNVNWASKSDYARLLFDAPSVEKRAKNRSDAIEMVYSAICKVKQLGIDRFWPGDRPAFRHSGRRPRHR